MPTTGDDMGAWTKDGRSRRRRVGIAAAAASIAIVVGAGATGGHLVATTTPPEVAGVASSLQTSTGSASIDWPSGVTAGAFAIPQLSGAEATLGTAEPLPMASIAKLVVALLVLERHPLADGEQGPAIAMTAEDVAALDEMRRLGASTLPLVEGDVLTQRQLLEASMLVSAGNASMTLARWAFGSQEAYLAEAAAWLQEQGLEGMTVVDASGISTGNVAPPATLLELMALVDATPSLRAIAGQTMADLPRLGRVQSTNGALGLAGIDSGKTGNLTASGQTVLVGATVVVGDVDVRIHAVLLGVQPGVDRDAAITSLIAGIAANLAITDLVAEGTVVATYAGPWGERVLLETKETASALVWPGQQVELRVDVPRDVGIGEQAEGSVEVVTPDEVIRVRVGTHETFAGPDLGWRLDHAPEVLGWALERRGATDA